MDFYCTITGISARLRQKISPLLQQGKGDTSNTIRLVTEFPSCIDRSYNNKTYILLDWEKHTIWKGIKLHYNSCSVNGILAEAKYPDAVFCHLVIQKNDAGTMDSLQKAVEVFPGIFHRTLSHDKGIWSEIALKGHPRPTGVNVCVVYTKVNTPQSFYRQPISFKDSFHQFINGLYMSMLATERSQRFIGHSSSWAGKGYPVLCLSDCKLNIEVWGTYVNIDSVDVVAAFCSLPG